MGYLFFPVWKRRVLYGILLSRMSLEEWVMSEKRPIITVTGAEEYKKDMEQIQEKLTKQGCIVVSIGDYSKEPLTMRMDKIDLAEELFVINPIWKIEETTWMDICYARLTGKNVSSLESLSYREIQDKENDFLFQAEGLAQKQLEMAQHNDYLDKRDFVSFSYKGHTIYDPWIREDMQSEPFAWNLHEDTKTGVNPFEYYGKKTAARFIVECVEKNQ